MKKLCSLLVLALFLLGCSGNAGKSSEEATDEAVAASEEIVNQIESTTDEIATEAESLSSEIDSLLNEL